LLFFQGERRGRQGSCASASCAAACEPVGSESVFACCLSSGKSTCLCCVKNEQNQEDCDKINSDDCESSNAKSEFF